MLETIDDEDDENVAHNSQEEDDDVEDEQCGAGRFVLVQLFEHHVLILDGCEC